MWIRNLGMAQLAGGSSRFLMSCSQGVGWAVEAETKVSWLPESGSQRAMIRDGASTRSKGRKSQIEGHVKVGQRKGNYIMTSTRRSQSVKAKWRWVGWAKEQTESAWLGMDRVGRANRMVRKELAWKRQPEHPDLGFQLLQLLAPAPPGY